MRPADQDHRRPEHRVTGEADQRERDDSPGAERYRTTEVVELEIKVKVPLIGGKLERLMAEKVAAGMDVEHSVGVAWLKEH